MSKNASPKTPQAEPRGVGCTSLVRRKRGRPLGSRKMRVTGSAITPPQHAKHYIYLDAEKRRSVVVSCPIVVTRAELQRIQGWLATLFIVGEPNAASELPTGR